VYENLTVKFATFAFRVGLADEKHYFGAKSCMCVRFLSCDLFMRCDRNIEDVMDVPRWSHGGQRKVKPHCRSQPQGLYPPHLGIPLYHKKLIGCYNIIDLS
jgi:hypothetical protein